MPAAAPEERVLPTANALADEAANLFLELAAESIRSRGIFRVALSGGSTPEKAHRRLAEEPRRSAIDWKRVEVFFGDERSVPFGAPERNDRAAREALLDHVPIPAENVHSIEADSPEGAQRYEALLHSRFVVPMESIPRFDLIFLGLGPDGHTASLFPEHPALNVTKRLVVRIAGSPKPPPERVTFTFPLLNGAAAVAFLVAGADKRSVCARARNADISLPAGRVRPENGRLIWLLDEAAA